MKRIEAKRKLFRLQRLDLMCLTIYVGSQSTSELHKVRNERFKKYWHMAMDIMSSVYV